MKQFNVYKYQPLFHLDCHPPPTLNLQNFTHFLSFSQKVIMVLIVLELHEPFWVLIYLTHVPLFLNNCVWVSFLIFSIAFLPLFQAYVLDALQACVLDVFPNSCWSSKLAFLMFFKFTFLLLFLDTCLLLLSITFLLLQAWNKSFCCSKFTFLLVFSIVFLLLQVHILTSLFSCVLVAPSS